MGLERSISDDIEAKIARTLIPYVGAGNYTISVNTKLNADRRQTSETTFDPNSRVERSIRTVKESGEAQNAQNSAGVTAEQNIPVEQAANPSGDKSSEKKDRKEELTNYEINSRSVSTTSDGYGIDKLSVAVVVNKAMLTKDLGASPSPDDISARVAELQKLVASASGITADRGDTITLTAVDFLTEDGDPPTERGQIGDWFSAHAASLLNAGALLLVTMLVLLLGLRPALRVIMSDRIASSVGPTPALPGITDPAGMPLADMSSGSAALDNLVLPQIGVQDTDPLFDSLAREVANSPKDRLVKIVELDPERAVEVMKQWLREPNGQTA
jgi:flagellar M-ring protein FliF